MSKVTKARRRTRIPNRLWSYRKRMGFTQRQVAELTGYHSRRDIGHFERGLRFPSLHSALKLEIVYRVPVAFLFPELYLRLKEKLRAREDELRPIWSIRRKRR